MKFRTSAFVIVAVIIITLISNSLMAATINVLPGDSIQSAIDSASNGDTIIIQSGNTYSEYLYLSGKNLTITTTYPTDPESTVIAASIADSVLEIAPNIDSTTTIEGITFQGGQGMGGGIHCNGSPVIQNCRFDSNYSGTYYNGGGICITIGSPEIIGCVFYNNETNSGHSGGGAYIANNASPKFTDCQFTDNSATEGAAVYINTDSSARFIDCSFGSNEADYGAGVYVNTDATAYFTNCSFDGITASENGGACYINSSLSVSFANCSFENSIANNGGAVYIETDASPTFTSNSFSNNSASNNGGAVYMNTDAKAMFSSNTFSSNTGGLGSTIYSGGASGLFTNCDFTSNIASGGGVVYCTGGLIALKNCTFQDNTVMAMETLATGTVTLTEKCSANIENCTFTDNFEVYAGGIVCREESSSMTVDNCSFFSNEGLASGAIANYMTISNSDLTTYPIVNYKAVIKNCTFEDNTGSYAGAVYNYGSSASYVNCMFDGNYISTDGAAVAGAAHNDTCLHFLNYTNCVFVNNHLNALGPAKGGAMYNTNCDTVINNCTFKSNKTNDSDTSYGGAIHNVNSNPVISNSIFRLNNRDSDVEIYNESSNPTIKYCCIYDSYDSEGNWDSSLGTDGGGNIDTYMYFVSDTDLSLKPFSPCIDAGNNFLASMDYADIDGDGITQEYVGLDINGNSRYTKSYEVDDTGISAFPGTPIVDMGAYEYQGADVKADLNDDGSVNILDLAIMADYWLK